MINSSNSPFYQYHKQVVDKGLYIIDSEDQKAIAPMPSDFLLQEDGSFLLQEDGSKIIIL